jgi:hypothetical protein
MQVILPLAGKGKRLRPHTHLVPKPLLKVAGRPVLDWVMDTLRGLPVSELIFITGHLHEQVEEYARTRGGISPGSRTMSLASITASATEITGFRVHACRADYVDTLTHMPAHRTRCSPLPPHARVLWWGSTDIQLHTTASHTRYRTPPGCHVYGGARD